MVSLTLYRRLSSFFPRKITKGISKLMVQGGFENLDARTFIGFAVFFSVGAALITFFLAPFFFAEAVIHWSISVFAFFLCLGLFYLGLTMSADARARQVEEVLPVALQMISANIRAGMTLENAVWSSARPEFGAFTTEIKRMSADAFGGVPISQTLADLPKRVNSQILDRAIRLVVEGMVLGGEMAKLLDEVSDDIRSTQLLQKEIAVSTTTYAIFIIFASIIAAPLLFSVSTYYTVLTEKIGDMRADTPQGSEEFSRAAQTQGLSGLPGLGQSQASGIKASDVKNFAIASISITSLFAALILGLIREGKAMRGLKYAPIFILVGLGVYFGFSQVLDSAFSTIIK
jgi:flagellar protein FlaJ